MAFGVDLKLLLVGLLIGVLSFFLPSFSKSNITTTWHAAKRYQDRTPIIKNHDPFEDTTGESLVANIQPRVRSLQEEQSMFGKDAKVLSSPPKNEEKKPHIMPIYFISSEGQSSNVKNSWDRIGEELEQLSDLKGILALHMDSHTSGNQIQVVVGDSQSTGNYQRIFGGHKLQGEDVYYDLQNCKINSSTILRSESKSSSPAIQSILSARKKSVRLHLIDAYISKDTSATSLIRLGDCISHYRSQGVVIVGLGDATNSFIPVKSLTNLVTHFTLHSRDKRALSLYWEGSSALPLLAAIGAAKEQEGELLLQEGNIVHYRFGDRLGDSDQHLNL